jgi:hypothetical protein
MSNTPPTSINRSRPAAGNAKPESVTDFGCFYPWIDHTRHVMQWMENKRASTPFHKSRLLLLLKDVLLRRQKAAILLMLQPTLDQHAANLDWLRIVWLMSRNYAPIPAVGRPRGISPGRVESNKPSAFAEVSETDSNNFTGSKHIVEFKYPAEEESESPMATPPHMKPRHNSRASSRSRVNSVDHADAASATASASPHRDASSNGRSRVNSVDAWDGSTHPSRGRVRIQTSTAGIGVGAGDYCNEGSVVSGEGEGEGLLSRTLQTPKR